MQNQNFLVAAGDCSMELNHSTHPRSTLEYPFVWGNSGDKRVLEYARLAMGFANVRASRYGIRKCLGGYSSTNAGAGAGAGGELVVEGTTHDIRRAPPHCHAASPSHGRANRSG